jgi:rhomboid protease GluP
MYPNDNQTPAPPATEFQAPAPRRFTPPTPVVTYTLIAINVLVFLGMLVNGANIMGPTSYQMIHWGANFGPLTVHGQWWRLFTACFLHFGIIHIGFNMWVLYQIGLFTEPLFGPFLYLALYLLAGICGNFISLIVHPMGVGAGASGAIFGVYGGLLAFLLRYRGVVNPAASKAVTRSVLIFLAYNLFYGLADRSTDLTAHIGGLATGFLAGLILAPNPVSRLRTQGRTI